MNTGKNAMLYNWGQLFQAGSYTILSIEKANWLTAASQKPGWIGGKVGILCTCRTVSENAIWQSGLQVIIQCTKCAKCALQAVYYNRIYPV